MQLQRHERKFADSIDAPNYSSREFCCYIHVYIDIVNSSRSSDRDCNHTTVIVIDNAMEQCMHYLVFSRANH